MSKAIRSSILVSLALAWMSGSALAQGGVTTSTKNPQQVATQHWYPANLTTSFPVGTALGLNPFGVTFDGDNVWVVDPGSNNVTKLRASDGARLGTFAVGAHPMGVAFDEVNIWVTNTNGGSVTKLRVTDGAVLGTFVLDSPGSGGPGGIAFDGTNIWVADNRVSTNVKKVRATDGTVLGTIPIGSASSFLSGVVSDGANILVTDTGTTPAAIL